jgi:para-aminobenzoate synthetase component I
MIWDWMKISKTWIFLTTADLMRKRMTFNGHLKRTFVSFPITDFSFIKQQMLTWASPFNICCFLDNHAYTLSPHSFECLLAAGAVDSIQASAGNAFQQLKDFAATRRDWLFGHFAYGLAKETEPAHATTPSPARNPDPAATPFPLPDPIGFPDLFFFLPEILIELQPGSIRIGSFRNDQQAIWQEILQIPPPTTPGPDPRPIPTFTPRFSREEYLATVGSLQQHILRGDCYEINFCQEFFSQPIHIDPWQTWRSLSQASPNPFSAFYRLDERFLLCASPERYLKKTGTTLLSQPIKGTSPRFRDDPAADLASQGQLYDSPKDRSENVMVVDLVRNDLSKICLAGTVRVEELYGIYSFPQVYQMISTIRGELASGYHWVDAIRSTFPMGSMTGAPKNRVVDLIERYERTGRGLFSGAIGYITPEEDFDFNVVIRSLQYNRQNNYLSYLVGSGITFYSDPRAEYEECLIKAEGIKKALGNE